MSLHVLFSAAEGEWPRYAAPLRAACAAAGLDAELSETLPTSGPAGVDYIIGTASGPVRDFTPYTSVRAMLSLWAGVERLLANPTLTQPIVRMIDPGLTAGMVEWVAGHALRHHLGLDRLITGQGATWNPIIPPLAAERSVAVLGLGALGAASARALAGLGFRVAGWSRSPKNISGIACHSGPAGLESALRGAEIVVLLLPETPATTDILDARTLGWLAQGAVVLNPGRGPLIDDRALLAALDAGRIGHATLDVFRTEPLPPEHPYWAHPRVTVSPHVASATRPETAARALAASITEMEAGCAPAGLVDRARGY